MNRKKQKLIEIFLITFFFIILVILFKLQSFIIAMLLMTSLVIILYFKNEIIRNILPKKTKYILNFIFFDIFLVISMIIIFGNDVFNN